jgi:hypothetical protein
LTPQGALNDLHSGRREVKAPNWVVDNRVRCPLVGEADEVRPIPSIAAAQCGVFSALQATLCGWSKAALAHGVRSGRLHRLRVGAYEVADLDEVTPGLSAFETARWRHAAPAIAAALMTVGAVPSHSTAAVLQQVPLIFLPKRACLSVIDWHTGEVPGIHLHRTKLVPPPLWEGGLNALPVEQTVIDLSREHGVAAGVVAADHLLHTRGTTLFRLQEALERCCGWPGVRAARAAIDFADGRSESVLESRSRLAMHEWGLPAPQPQAVIGNEWGGFVARVDFYWDEFGVVGEVDGDIKYGGTDPTPLLEEKRRERKLDDLELPVVRWGPGDLRNFGSVAARLRRTFSRAARTPCSERRWTVLPPALTSQGPL